MLQIVALLTDNSKGIIYDHNMFMQAPDLKFHAKCLNQLQLQSAVFAVTKTFTAFNKLARSAS